MLREYAKCEMKNSNTFKQPSAICPVSYDTRIHIACCLCVFKTICNSKCAFGSWNFEQFRKCSKFNGYFITKHLNALMIIIKYYLLFIIGNGSVIVIPIIEL